jgi:hypothetical protein
MRGASGRTGSAARRGDLPLLAGVLGLLALGGIAPASAQSPDSMLDFAGERLTYRVSVSRFGNIGRGSMTMGGPVDVRGVQAYVLRFEFDTRVGPVKVVNRSESWVDVASGASLRFHKHEAHPLSKHDETVELFPSQRRWEAADGTRGDSPTDAPLDELSYIYHLRTMELLPDSTYSLTRHFDAARNPTVFRVLRRDTVETKAGTFPVIVVEMRVKDPRRYRGEGVLRFFLSDDADRVPVRMESSMPVVGSAVLSLEARTHITGRIAASAPEP